MNHHQLLNSFSISKTQEFSEVESEDETRSGSTMREQIFPNLFISLLKSSHGFQLDVCISDSEDVDELRANRPILTDLISKHLPGSSVKH